MVRVWLLRVGGYDWWLGRCLSGTGSKIVKSSALLLSDFTWDYALPGQPCRSCAGVIVFLCRKASSQKFITLTGAGLCMMPEISIFIAQRFVIFLVFYRVFDAFFGLFSYIGLISCV